MITFNELFELISEGYNEVKVALITAGVPEKDVKSILNLHKTKKNQNILPSDLKNIDAYFSKANQAKTNKTVGQLFGDLKNQLSEIQTKKERQISSSNKNLITENGEYMLFKVTTYEDAYNLKWKYPKDRIEWCICADGENGKKMFDYYTANNKMDEEDMIFDDYEFTKDFTVKNDKVYNKFFPFYFAFRKNPIDDKMDYLAIQNKDGKFEYTYAPNVNPPVEGWPDTLPVEWQQKIHSGDYVNVQLEDLTTDDWTFLIVKYPQFAKYCDKWNEFDEMHLIILFAKQPQSAKYYNKWDEFGGWDVVLSYQPQFEDICTKYDGWSKFNTGGHWVCLLISQPQFKDICTEYNGWNKFEGHDWSDLLSSQPQFKDICTEYNGWNKFEGHDWLWLLRDQPQFKDICTEYNGWGEFTRSYWCWLLKEYPHFEDIAKKYPKGQEALGKQE